jgi:hypothetical protein
VAELFVGVFRRDLLNFFPQSRFELVDPAARPADVKAGPQFQIVDEPLTGGDPIAVEMIGVRYTLTPRAGTWVVGRFFCSQIVRIEVERHGRKNSRPVVVVTPNEAMDEGEPLVGGAVTGVYLSRPGSLG